MDAGAGHILLFPVDMWPGEEGCYSTGVEANTWPYSKHWL